MSNPFLGEVKMVSFNFPPKGWALCNGQFLPINQNQALFSLLGTTYGGNGQTTFALPDLQARAAAHTGNDLQLGQSSGEPQHTLTIPEMGTHSHQPNALSDGPTTSADPANNLFAPSSGNVYGATQWIALAPEAVTIAGSSQPHENMMPSLVVNFIIALAGIFPSRN
jgi:microcystin-dependent protein